MGFEYIIEHMEEDEETTRSVPPWVELEYAHMLTLAGPHSKLHFTHLSKSSCDALLQSPAFIKLKNEDIDTPAPAKKSRAEGFTHQSGVMDLLTQRTIGLDRVCLLDPKAPAVLSPEDGDGRFDWFLFGGILGESISSSISPAMTWTLISHHIFAGDDPPRDRTSELRRLGFPTRHLGPVQMTTDTALGVTKLVAEDKIPLNKIFYVDFPTIRFNSKESVEMPFRYIAKDGEPILPPGMCELLREDLNKTFDF